MKPQILQMVTSVLVPATDIDGQPGTTIFTDAHAAGFTLQSTANLGSPAVWTTNAPAPVVLGGHNTITYPIVVLVAEKPCEP